MVASSRFHASLPTSSPLSGSRQIADFVGPARLVFGRNRINSSRGFRRALALNCSSPQPGRAAKVAGVEAGQ
jgi:hypothetical protein